MNELHLEEIAFATLALLYGLLAIATWRAAVIWSGLARSLTAASAALSLAAAYFAALVLWPVVGQEPFVSGIWILLIGTGLTAIYYIQRETRRVHGGYEVARAEEVVQQSKETGRLADETQRVADETQRVANAAEVQNTAASHDVLGAAASAAADVLSTAAVKAAEVLNATTAASNKEGKL